MKKYVCTICGYVYDEATGMPEAGIPAGTKWEALPPNWTCPICGASKEQFVEQGAPEPVAVPVEIPVAVMEKTDDMTQLSPLELSALCSNLARGCEKQYQPDNAALFTQLAEYFRAATPPAENPDIQQLLALVEQDLSSGFPRANAVAGEAKDRGALRSLVWSEKVTRMLNSLLTRYAEEGEAMLKNTNVYVCTICGFVYIGGNPPEICPVCKVPSWKFEKIEGGAQNV
ncbi:MAG: rubredoxin [Oscillospiraceae bacterium]